MKRLILTLCFLLFGCARPAQPEITTYGTVPAFSLADQTGKTITLHDLAGHVWIADFIFTNCGGTCPVMSQSMRKLQDALPQEIRMVSFTVDPTRDTPQVLGEYAKRYGAREDRWLFLTGEKDILYNLSIKGFKLALEDTGGTEVEPITHSSRFVLVDRQGQIRGYYSGVDEEELKRLSEDVKTLL